MTNLAVLGAQWGDEGKGKIVDALTFHVDVVVRFGGGSNAGHTLVVDGRKVVVHLLPSGVVHRGKVSVLGPGMVIDPEALLGELADLEKMDLRPDPEMLRISDRAHLVLAYHRELDGLREATPQAIGTTRRGIGPAYEDKVARRGIRVCDLRHPQRLAERLRSAVQQANERIVQLGGRPVDGAVIEQQLESYARELGPYIDDTSSYLAAASASGKRVLFEGAQGLLLDVDHGTYPFVTSSTTLAGGACGGAGVGPRHLGQVIGVSKCYVTRVGDGPFPTEIEGERGRAVRELGGEFGATTGRPRRCGWLDLPALRYAARVAGLDWLALTKLDVLAAVDQPRLCTAYRLRGELIDTLPADVEDIEAIEPVYEDIPDLQGCLNGFDPSQPLPAAATRLIERIESAVGVPVAVVSYGPERHQTIVRPPFSAAG